MQYCIDVLEVRTSVCIGFVVGPRTITRSIEFTMNGKTASSATN